MILKIRRAAQSLPFKGKVKQLLFQLKLPIYTNRLKRYHQRSLLAASYPSILIIMNGGIGNAVEATPLVQAIRTIAPKSYISLLGPAGDLFDDWCVVDEIISGTASLTDRKFDLTLVTHACEMTTKLTDTGMTPGAVFEAQHAGMQFVKPEREYNLDMARKLGFKGDGAPLYVTMKKPVIEISSVPQRLVIAPGGKPLEMWRHKRWPFYTELADQLLRKYPELELVIIGTTSDQFELPANGQERVVDLRGRLSLAESSWVLRHSTLAIGNDCGPMHIADAVQTVSLVIFGATCELKNGPLYKAVPVVSAVACRPCQYEDRMLTCQTSRCLTEITVEQMMGRIELMLPSDQR